MLVLRQLKEVWPFREELLGQIGYIIPGIPIFWERIVRIGLLVAPGDKGPREDICLIPRIVDVKLRTHLIPASPHQPS